MAIFKRRNTGLAKQLRNNATLAERRLWTHLSRRQLLGHKFDRQVPIGDFIADFVCRKTRLIVELDGGQHACDADKDPARTKVLEAQGYRVIRFWNNEVPENTESVLYRIGQALEMEPTPLPSRKREGRILSAPLR